MTHRLIVLDDAEAELEDAARWYEAQRPGLGREFRAAVAEAMDRLTETPGVALPVPSVSPEVGARCVFVKRFPYSIVFFVHGQEMWVVAFAHHHRRPGYWRNRPREGRS
jgi:plasmid stabilization system protein ParE